MEKQQLIDETLKENPNTPFLALIKVGRAGIWRAFIDEKEFNKFYDRAWDRGLDLEVDYIRKSDPLFDECLANVSDEIIQEVNNKLDGRLNKTKN